MTVTQNIPDSLISQVSDFVNSRTGLYFPKEKWRDLKRGIKWAAREKGFEDTKLYLQQLLSSQMTKSQLDTLIEHLTIGETFFFRDKKLFQALKDNILSGWIRSPDGRGKRIRFWSAGCCTGEEPYSIAILMDQLIPKNGDWDISIRATDINDRFIDKAVNGVYTS